MPPLLEFHGSVTTLGMLLQENSTSQAFLTMKELLPAIKEIKTASSHASSGLLLVSLISAAIACIMCDDLKNCFKWRCAFAMYVDCHFNWSKSIRVWHRMV